MQGEEIVDGGAGGTGILVFDGVHDRFMSGDQDLSTNPVPIA